MNNVLFISLAIIAFSFLVFVAIIDILQKEEDRKSGKVERFSEKFGNRDLIGVLVRFFKKKNK